MLLVVMSDHFNAMTIRWRRRSSLFAVEWYLAMVEKRMTMMLQVDFLRSAYLVSPILRWGCREHFVSGCWHSSGRDRGRYPRECWLSTLGVLHPGVPVMWYCHIRDLFPTAGGCMGSRLPNATMLHWAEQRYALVGSDGWVIGRLVGHGLYHQSYHTLMHTTQHQRIFLFPPSLAL